jgi:molybdopterin molybdotransferase
VSEEKGRRRFLKPVSLAEAFELASSSFSLSLRTKIVKLEYALGTILAEDIYSSMDMPPEDRAFYDGFALRSEDVERASSSAPAVLAIKERGPVGRGEAVPIGAGEPLPEGADSVARTEICEVLDKRVLVKAPLRKGENLIKRGGDLRKGEVALERGRSLRPQDIALAMELGLSEVRVYEKPKVAVMHVGKEVLEKREKGFPYPDNFSQLASLMLKSFGFETTHLGIFPENAQKFVEVALKAMDNYDALVVVGRASIGEEDLVPRVLQDIGRIVFHGVGVSPGKVSGLAVVKEKPVFMVPAHVGSAMASLLLIVIPALTLSLYGSREPYFRLRAKLKGYIEGRHGLAAFRTVAVKREGEGFAAYPVSKELGGSPFLTSLTRANGFVILEPGSKLKEGESVEVRLFSPQELLPCSLLEKSK